MNPVEYDSKTFPNASEDGMMQALTWIYLVVVILKFFLFLMSHPVCNDELLKPPTSYIPSWFLAGIFWV